VGIAAACLCDAVKMGRNLLNTANRHWARTQAFARGWLPGREALRTLCAAPHSEVNATISKLWLIGRSHSAALDRTHVGWEPGRYQRTADKLRTIGLDRLLRAIRERAEAYDERHVELIETTVEAVASVFWKTTQQWKVSLASKYLHYHAASVPMYDSVSRWWYASFTERGQRAAVATRSDAYGRHLARFLTIRARLIAHGVKHVTAGTLDDFVINL
jgi:hypothetical protein